MSNDLKNDWLHRLVGGRHFSLPIAFLFLLIAAVSVGVIVEGCSNSVSPASGMATVSLKVSDPATCLAPNGPFSHVYVTISDVQVNASSTAGDNDSSWVDLTPSLAKAPQQIDLLGLANNNCFLASLGDTLQLQAGSYQQIRVILTDSTTALPSGTNKCTTTANCVVVSANTYPLQLSSETKTGIKIPSGQIANGSFTIAAGQTKDLDIDFNTCVSIVLEGNGQYRLKPVLHAGEVSLTSTSINGTVIDSATGNHITGTAIVALEQKDTTTTAGIDRVFMSTVTDASGNFVFCPLPAGPYDVVIVGKSSTGVVYSPTVVTGVATGSAMGNVQLHALPVVSVAAATLQGVVTTQTGATPPVGTVADVQLSTLEAVSSTLTVTVPLLPTATQSSAVLALATASGSSCPSGTDCVSYSIQVSAGPAFVGTSGTAVAQSALPVAYLMDGIASLPSSGGAVDCSPSDVMSTAVTPVVSVTTAAPTLKFLACQ